jgi:hypothetical protein
MGNSAFSDLERLEGLSSPQLSGFVRSALGSVSVMLSYIIDRFPVGVQGVYDDDVCYV